MRPLAPLAAILFTAQLMISMPAFGVQLSDFKWQNRLLLIFAPSQQDPELLQTRRALQGESCGLGERNIVTGILVAQGRSSLDGREITARDAAAIRQRTAIKNDQFAVLLIGKDGGEKLRVYNQPDLDAVFALIDQMPMRQEEMRINPTACGKDPA